MMMSCSWCGSEFERNGTGRKREFCSQSCRQRKYNASRGLDPSRKPPGETNNYSERNNVLYRFFDSGGNLLYVGITVNPGSRIKMHAAQKDWWETVETIKLQHFASREELEAAEEAAIKTEFPVYNKIHKNL